MRQSRQANLLLVLALAMIATAFGAYTFIVLRWLAPAPPVAAPGRPEPGAELAAARLAFRARLLDPAAHLGLSEALWKAGRPVDSFYVAQAARELFGDAAFAEAHAKVVLGAGGPAAAARKRLDAVHDLTARIPALAETARAHADAPEGAECLEELARLASQDENAEGGESARLARSALEELHADDPKHAGKLAALGRALLDKGELATAQAVASEALSKQEDHAGAAQIMGALALRQRDLEGARRWLSLAWDRNPDDSFSAAKLAQLYDRRRAEPEAALPFYIALHRRSPDHADGEARVDRRIREILDSRREALLRDAPVESLGSRLEADDASLRAEACARAAALKDPRWVRALAARLDDDAEIVRHNADYALFEIGKRDPAALRALREELLSGGKPLVRVRALHLFADLDGKNALPAAIAALRDRDPAVRALVKVMVFDRYYKDAPEGARARERYAAEEQDPAARALLARFPGGA